MTRKLKTVELNRLSVDEFKQSDKIPCVVVLDNIRSAYNVGAIFRTADGFLLERVLLCGITPTPPHKEIYKTAIGAENSMQWEYHQDVAKAIVTLKQQGYFIVALEQTSDSTLLQDWIWKKGTKFALVLGNEVDGISDSAMPLCDAYIEIPQFGTKHSFNVAVAAGMLIWDMIRAIKK
ncbi:MAG: RNA methyltransferase [Bacteroidia bacterium]|jgi:tRNA G18 (ribose-2'-O)-methylase SpoU|nr:RNA methyltransferase [Bacteroidia bacterium]MCO5253986.1 RNA methyltransferase [Bacteroidota bacterium]MCZ2128653.1 RNA methyltransferase [Bacteroidia bacterium]